MAGTASAPTADVRRAEPAPTLLEPAPSTGSEPDQRSPFRAALTVWLIGYVILATVMLGIGLLLTHALDGTVGRWDEHVNEWFADHRTVGWNDITKVATAAFNTLPVVATAAGVVGLLAWRRHWREAAFLVLALTLEITVFLSVTFVVARDRPDVPRLNSTPATSSFPSGHTAAATVLFVGLAVIVICCTRNRLARVVFGLLAVVVPVLVGFARVYRGLHHPTDVFAGLLFGLACLFVAALAVRAGSRQAAARARSESEDADVERHPRADDRPKLAAG